MAEDLGLCTYVRHHQQKIVLFLAAMRAYRDELRDAGYDVHYVELDPSDARPYEEKVQAAIADTGATAISHFEIEDKAMEQRLVGFAAEAGLDRNELRSPMFSCSREDFSSFVTDKRRILMHDFYVEQRRRLGILVDDDGEPEGGRWSFDADNRKKLPAGVAPPPVGWPEPAAHVEDVIRIVE